LTSEYRARKEGLRNDNGSISFLFGDCRTGIGRRGCFLFALHAVVVVVVVIFIIFSIDGSLLSLKQEVHLQQVQQVRAIEPAGTLLAQACAARRCQLSRAAASRSALADPAGGKNSGKLPSSVVNLLPLEM
jgi:hypothetical protein